MSELVDWIVAEWIATRVAGAGTAARSPQLEELPALAELAEARIVDYTGLVPARALPVPEAIGRREWVRANLASMRRMMEPMLARAGGGFGPLRPALELSLGLAVSSEVGLLVGYLAQRVLGQYELVLLDEATVAPPRLLFVAPNLAKATAGFDADEREFLTWVTLHEVTHAVQFAGVPWLQPYLAGLVGEMMAAAELRLDERAARRRPRLPSRAELRRVGTALGRGDLIGAVTSEAERATIDRIQAVMAVIEGHAEHVMDAVAPELIPSLPQLRAALDARRSSGPRRSRLIGRLLGLELKLRQYERGKAFCDAVATAAGPGGLARVFDGPEGLPTLEEIERPEVWLARRGIGAVGSV